MYSLIVSDGTTGPIFLTTDKKFNDNIEMPPECYIEYIPATKKISERRGERGMLAFLEKSISDTTLVPGDLLLSDNEASFKTQLVEDKLYENRIQHLFFPTYLGHLMNPCDSFYHSSIKARYWKYVGQEEEEGVSLSVEKMVKLIHRSVAEEKEESIQHYFEHCGITGSKSPEKSMKKLLSQGLHPTKKFHNLHLQQLKSFIDWRWNGNESIRTIFGEGYNFDQILYK